MPSTFPFEGMSRFATLALLAPCVAAHTTTLPTPLAASLAALPQLVIRRSPPVRCAAASAAGPYSSDDWDGGSWRKAKEDAEEEDEDADAGWLQLGGCDVLLPAGPCVGVVHFVGGALVGVAPQSAYGSFLARISTAASVAVVATPCDGLSSGLDHWAAASEVMMRWCAAQEELHVAMRARGVLAPEALPVLGCGHSLGAKLLVLLGADEQLADALGPRCANVLVSYNNFAAARSIPLLQQALSLRDGVQRGDFGSGVPAVSGALELGARLGAGAGAGLVSLGDSIASGAFTGTIADSVGRLGDSLGVDLRGTASRAPPVDPVVADRLASGLGEAGRALSALGREAAAATGGSEAGSGLDGEVDFSPSPEVTNALILSSYAVGRNLVVRFADDSIDQSRPIATLFKTRFTDDVTGIGGRLDFKSLEGTHVTPNTPSLSEYMRLVDWQMAAQLPGGAEAANAVRDLASRTEREQLAAAAIIAEFVEREASRAAA